MEANCNPKPRVQVSNDDRQRMARLYEEVIGRVAEMGQIVARNLEFGPRYPVSKFTLNVGADAGRVVDIEFEPEPVIGDKNGCYKDPPGVCCECPCD